MKATLVSVVILTGILAAVGCSSGGEDPDAVDTEDLAGSADCDIAKVTCEIVAPKCADGKTPSVTKSGCYGKCVSMTACKAGTLQCTDGPALCEILPAKCGAGKTRTIKDGCYGPCVPSNVCKGPKPVGGGGAAGGSGKKCNVAAVRCEIVPPHCPEGQTATATADNDCYGPCVPIEDCADHSFQCSAGPAFCEVLPAACGADETRTTKDGCYGPCVPSRVCR